MPEQKERDDIYREVITRIERRRGGGGLMDRRRKNNQLIAVLLIAVIVLAVQNIHLLVALRQFN